ncbi:CHAD domain-containing protein [Cellulomonas sp.]|uniref:CHAD domain-containing protein n=1 Tax=Cellulomonas sp. TaxID=40001 RepID=UPI003BAB0877
MAGVRTVRRSRRRPQHIAAAGATRRPGTVSRPWPRAGPTGVVPARRGRRHRPGGRGGPAIGTAHDEALHEVRKAARRARYASEVAAVSVGKPARRSARRAHGRA